jgi:hypothetical protein
MLGEDESARDGVQYEQAAIAPAWAMYKKELDKTARAVFDK